LLNKFDFISDFVGAGWDVTNRNVLAFIFGVDCAAAVVVVVVVAAAAAASDDVFKDALHHTLSFNPPTISLLLITLDTVLYTFAVLSNTLLMLLDKPLPKHILSEAEQEALLK
jgi:hypothetical protein